MSLLPRIALRWFGAGATLSLSFLILFCAASGRSQPVSEGQDKAAPPAPRPPSTPPPLELDEEPLRLESPARPAPAASKQIADNGSCLVCHANFRKESLAASHASHAVSCASCHGPSLAHRNDEANIIPPDRMFAVESIDASCARCHESHDVEPRLVVKRFLERSPSQADRKTLACTTCHGEHRLAVRTVHWDRKTGKLVSAARP